MTEDVVVESCPKCGAPRAEARPACAKCGLLVAKMAEFAQQRDDDAPAVVKAAWDRLVDAWDDGDRHAAFLRIVVDESAFAWAAARYREKRPDARAELGLERVRKAAEARLVASASARPEPKSVFSSVKLLLGGAVIMIVALVLMLQFIRGKRHAAAHKPPVAPHSTKVR